MSQTILAISFGSKKIGAAYYDEDDSKVHILHDLAEDDDFTTLNSLLREVQPTHVIVNRSQDVRFQTRIRRETCPLKENEDDDSLSKINITNTVNTSRSEKQQNCSTVLANIRNLTECSQAIDTSTRKDITDLTVGTITSNFSRSSNATESKNSEENPPKFRPNETPTLTGKRPSAQLLVGSLLGPPTPKTPKYQPPNKEEEDEERENNGDPKELEEDFMWRPSISLLPNIAFSFSEARKKLEEMFVDGTRDEQLITSFRLDFSSTNMIRSLGALLRFLDQQRVGVEYEDYSVKTPIKSIHTVTLENCVEVDQITLKALEIFYADYRPDCIRKKFVWGHNRKEGMSVFKLCNLCRGSPGKNTLRQWFELPTRSKETLTQRLDGISFFFHDCNLDATSYIRNLMKDITAVKAIFKKMQRGNASVNDWKNLYTTMCTLVKLGQYLREREVNFGLAKDRLCYFNEDLTRLSAVLVEMIDFQESITENRLVINSGRDLNLDKLKQEYDRLPTMLTEVAKIEADELYISECSVAYMPILGYLLMVPEADRPPTSPNVTMVFSSDGMIYYKTPRMNDLDSQVGDIKMQIIDVETTISLRLQRLMLKNSRSISKSVQTAGILDALTSLAVVAREYNWVRPAFSEESVLDIQRARHPIAEHICKNTQYVSNPIISNNEYGKLKVLTGPNASGKSVYLKSVGIVVYLAHIGSYVPARRAVIGPVNRILSRMYTVDSVLDGMSSFANDLKQMSNAIRKSDANSLIIIDEFGKGTVTEVGLSLLASCLNWWIEGPLEKCPHVFVASHFYALRTLLTESELVRFQTMDVVRKADDTLDFQFKLVDGIIDMSYASLTALKMGVPRDVVDRAEEVYLHLRCGRSLAELEPESNDQKQQKELTGEQEEEGNENESQHDSVADSGESFGGEEKREPEDESKMNEMKDSSSIVNNNNEVIRQKSEDSAQSFSFEL